MTSSQIGDKIIFNDGPLDFKKRSQSLSKLLILLEVERIGKEISDIDPNLQVCVLDYRPEFRRGLIERKMIQRPSYQEMVEVYHLLRGTGLSTVLCQTPFGHIGPHVPDERR